MLTRMSGKWNSYPWLLGIHCYSFYRKQCESPSKPKVRSTIAHSTKTQPQEGSNWRRICGRGKRRLGLRKTVHAFWNWDISGHLSLHIYFFTAEKGLIYFLSFFNTVFQKNFLLSTIICTMSFHTPFSSSTPKALC